MLPLEVLSRRILGLTTCCNDRHLLEQFGSKASHGQLETMPTAEIAANPVAERNCVQEAVKAGALGQWGVS